MYQSITILYVLSYQPIQPLIKLAELFYFCGSHSH